MPAGTRARPGFLKGVEESGYFEGDSRAMFASRSHAYRRGHRATDKPLQIKPTDGLEPSTPPYHGGFELRPDVRGAALATALSLHLGHFVGPARPSSKRTESPRGTSNPSPEPGPRRLGRRRPLSTGRSSYRTVSVLVVLPPWSARLGASVSIPQAATRPTSMPDGSQGRASGRLP